MFSYAAAQLWRSLDIDAARMLRSAQLLASTQQLVQRMGWFAERAAFCAATHGHVNVLPTAPPLVEAAIGPIVSHMLTHLSPASLRQLESWLLPLTEGSVAALGRFSRLESLCLGHRKLPHLQAAAALQQLTALTSLELMGQLLGSPVMAAVTQLSRLRHLDLWTSGMLADVHRLSVLGSLTRLTLQDGSTWGDGASPIQLPPAAAFMGLARLDVFAYRFEASGLMDWELNSRRAD